jgi:hypothetical protein
MVGQFTEENSGNPKVLATKQILQFKAFQKVKQKL